MTFVQDEISPELAIEHWRRYLDGFKPCHFPGLLDGRPDIPHGFHDTSVNLDLGNKAVLELCSQHQLTPHSVLHLAWAIVIGCYAGVEYVSLSCSTDDGGFSNLKIELSFICCAQIDEENSLLSIMVEMKKNSNEALRARICSITEIQNFLGLEGQHLATLAYRSNVHPHRKLVNGRRTQTWWRYESNLPAKLLAPYET